MDCNRSLDLACLLRKHKKQQPVQIKHKTKPMQYESVAVGVKIRLDHNLKRRRSSRLTLFDRKRNLPDTSPCATPAPISEAQQKIQYRRQQLEKWKEEKEKKKQEAASKKIKPFLIGVPHNSLKYVPPPPLPSAKVVPSHSGRVTRSYSARNKKTEKESQRTQLSSFAPENAKFRAPKIKTLTDIPKLSRPNVKKDKKTALVLFKPILPAVAQTEIKKTRSRTGLKHMSGGNVAVSATVENKTRGKVARPLRQVAPESSNSEHEVPSKVHASSSSDNSPSNTVSSNSETDFPKMPNLSDLKPTRSKAVKKNATVGNMAQSKTVETRPRGKVTRSRQAPPMYLQSSSSSEKEILGTQTSSGSDDDITANIVSFSSNESAKSIQSSSSSELESEKKQGRISTNKSRKSVKSQVVRSTPRKSLTANKEENQLTPKNLVPKSESRSEERLRSPKDAESPLTPQQITDLSKKISPCVTMSRGKDNARREMKKKLNEGLLDEDSSDLQIDHFRRELASETERMTEMCNTWDKISEQVALPDNVQELVLAAVGQARLLMSKKLVQFASLVERCARPEPGQALVTRADLHGFWDMVFMQVENVDMRFKKLEELQARNWTEDLPQVEPRRAKPQGAAHRRNASRGPNGPSRLKEMIAAKRKAYKQELEPVSSGEEKTFDAGFFSVSSPVRAARSSLSSSPLAATPVPQNLLKAVLSNEAQKASASKKRASFAILRASVIGKDVEYEGVAPLPQTPDGKFYTNPTPGRSILKQQAHDDNVKTPGKKSVKLVLFNQSDSEPDDNTLPSVALPLPATPHTNSSAGNTAINIQVTVAAVDVLPASDNKENSRRSLRLSRQNAVESMEPITRSVRKCRSKMEEEKVTPRRSSRKKVLKEKKSNIF